MVGPLMIICALLLGTIAVVAICCAEYWREMYEQERKRNDGE